MRGTVAVLRSRCGIQVPPLLGETMTRPTFLPRRPRGTRWMAFALPRWVVELVKMILRRKG